MMFFKVALVLVACAIGFVGFSDTMQLPPLIDAFNQDICGKSNMFPWELRQSAFNCKDIYTRDSKRFRRIVGGDRAAAQAFPSYVTIVGPIIDSKMNTKNIICGATLIHSNLILTSAKCMTNQELSRILVRVDLTVDQRVHSIHHVTRACRPNGDNITMFNDDIAVLKFYPPVSYSGSLGPICIRASEATRSETICSIPGYGINQHEYRSPYLKFLEVRKLCAKVDQGSSSCYRASMESLETISADDLGGPVVCYDDCSYTNSQRQYLSALATGVDARGDITVTELAKLHPQLLHKLFSTISMDGLSPYEGTICEQVSPKPHLVQQAAGNPIVAH